MSDNTLISILIVAVLIVALSITTAITYSYWLETENTVPDCEEDEYIYYDDYPDGNLICVHVDELR